MHTYMYVSSDQESLNMVAYRAGVDLPIKLISLECLSDFNSTEIRFLKQLPS